MKLIFTIEFIEPTISKIFQYVVDIRIITDISYILIYWTKSSKSSVCFYICSDLNSDANFSLRTSGLYLDFIQFTVEKIESQNQIVPNRLKHFPLPESNFFSVFTFKLIKI